MRGKSTLKLGALAWPMYALLHCCLTHQSARSRRFHLSAAHELVATCVSVFAISAGIAAVYAADHCWPRLDDLYQAMKAVGLSFELRCDLTTDECVHSRSVAVRAGAMLRASLKRKHATYALTSLVALLATLRRLCE